MTNLENFIVPANINLFRYREKQFTWIQHQDGRAIHFLFSTTEEEFQTDILGVDFEHHWKHGEHADKGVRVVLEK